MLEQSPEGAEAADALAECSTLVELLEARQAALAATLEGAFPELRATIWQSEASVQAAVQVSATALGSGPRCGLRCCVLHQGDANRLGQCCGVLCRLRHAADSCPCIFVLLHFCSR